jgi:hypothetical protein
LGKEVESPASPALVEGTLFGELVNLNNPTAIKMAKITQWTHHTKKKNPAPEWKKQLSSNNP